MSRARGIDKPAWRRLTPANLPRGLLITINITLRIGLFALSARVSQREEGERTWLVSTTITPKQKEPRVHGEMHHENRIVDLNTDPEEELADAREPAVQVALVMLYLHSPPHILDTLGVAAGLAGAEEHRGNASRAGRPPEEREHIAKQPALEGAATSAQPFAPVIDAGPQHDADANQ